MSKKQLVVVGLFVFAILYVSLLALVNLFASGGGSGSYVSAGSGSGSPGGSKVPLSPAAAMKDVTEDGSIKAQVSSLDRDKFHLSLSLNVTDRSGKELGSLKEEEILVYEDGIPVATKKFEPAGQSGVRVGLLVDFGGYTGYSRGGGVTQGQREMIMVSMPSILKALQDQTDHYGLWVNNAYALAKNYREVTKMGPIEAGGREATVKRLDDLLDFRGADLFATMGLALSKMANVRGKRTLVVLTDGWDDITLQKMAAPTKTIQEEKRAQELKIMNDLVFNAKKYNIPIYMIQPAGGQANEEVMKKLANETGGEHYLAAGSAKLTDYLIQNVIEKLRKDYNIEYDTPNPVENGKRRKVEVVVRSGSSAAKTDTDYLMPGVVGAGEAAVPVATADSAGSDKGGAPVAVRQPSRPIAKVFFPLALLLGLLFGIPYLVICFWPRRSAESESASAPATPAPAAAAIQTPPPVAAAAPVAKLSPSAQGMQPRPVVAPVAKPTPGSAPGVNRLPASGPVAKLTPPPALTPQQKAASLAKLAKPQPKIPVAQGKVPPPVAVPNSHQGKPKPKV